MFQFRLLTLFIIPLFVGAVIVIYQHTKSVTLSEDQVSIMADEFVVAEFPELDINTCTRNAVKIETTNSWAVFYHEPSLDHHFTVVIHEDSKFICWVHM